MGIEQIRNLKSAEKVIKDKPRLKKRSKKMEGIMDLLKILYPPFLERKKKCEIDAPGCTGRATVVHHSKSRGKENILNVATWVASCPHCNGWLEENDKEAREAGFKESKF